MKNNSVFWGEMYVCKRTLVIRIAATTVISDFAIIVSQFEHLRDPPEGIRKETGHQIMSFDPSEKSS